MRTTVNLDEQLLGQAKELALRSGRSLGDVIDDALRAALARRPPGRRPSVELPTFGGSGLQSGVDLEDKDALAKLLGDEAGVPGAGT